MTKVSKKAVRAAIAVTMVLMVSACTKKSTESESSNLLRISTQAKIKGLDPVYADDLYAGAEVMRTYDCLLSYHYLKRPYTLQPNLVDAMPELSKDAKTYTFKLKKGVLFQDDASFKTTNGKGREMTAEDVIYSWKRLADPKVVSTGWWIFDGRIEGLNEWREAAQKSGAADYAAPVAGLKVVDHYTLQVTLKQASAQFLYYVAMPFAAVVPHEAVEQYGKEFVNHPVGTGAFRLREFNPSQRLIWVKNPTYRDDFYPSEGAPGDKEAGLLADAGKKLPLVDKIIVTIFVESQPQWLNFMSGRLDYSGIPKDNYAQAITSTKELSPEMKAKGIRLFKEAQLDVTHDSFNMNDPIVGKNKYLRQAISLAMPVEPLIDLFYNGRAIAAQGPIPPGLAGYDPAYRNPYRQFDLAKAKELMTKAGYPGGKGLAPIEYLTIADSTSRQMNEFNQKALKEIGVDLKISAFSWPEFSAAIRNRKGQMWGMAWAADYPDAENFLQLFYSKNASPGPNDSNYNNPVFDKLYDKALKLQDTAERTAIYQEMVKLVVEDCPWIPNVHRLAFGLVHPWVRNYKTNEFGGMTKYHRIDASLRK